MGQTILQGQGVGDEWDGSMRGREKANGLASVVLDMDGTHHYENGDSPEGGTPVLCG